MKEQKERFSKLERAFKILEYLKLNSDSEHTVTQAALRRESEIEPYLGDKETYNDTIVKMAMALNFDEYGVKSENEWKLIFKDFVKKFGAESLDESDSEDEYDDFQYGRLKTLEVYYLKPECWLTDNIDDAAIHDKTERLLRAVFLGALMALIACFRDGLGGKFTIRYFVKDL